MKIIFVLLALLLISFVVASFTPLKEKKFFAVFATVKARLIGIVIALAILISSIGWFNVKQQHIGLPTLSIGKNLPVGQVLAEDGTKGKQINTYSPGWHHSFKYPFFMDIEEQPFLEVNAGEFAILTAKDGKINDKIIAPKWSDDIDPIKMITDADYFLKNEGVRGIQQFKVMPGQYPINYNLFDVQKYKMENVPSNSVLVIESRFGKNAEFTKTTDDEILAVPLVPSTEYRGIVDNALASGLYAIHPYTEKGYTVPNTLMTFIYDGGYVKKTMDINIDPSSDKLITNSFETNINIPRGAHGAAFKSKTKDNFTVYIPLRILGQIEPIQSPRFVGTFGSVDKLENKLVEPLAKNALLDIITNYTAQEVITKRDEIGNKLSNILREKTTKAGFRTKSVQLGEVDIPPIVLLPKKIASASDELKNAMVRKMESVEKVIEVRRKQAEADSQKVVVDAEMKKKASIEEAEATEITAEAMKKKTMLEADAEKYAKNAKADAERYEKEQQAEGARKLIAEIGRENVGLIMTQDKINEGLPNMKVPNELTIIGGEAAKANPSLITSTLLRQGLKAK